jgi:hypothetical protein
MLRCQSATPIVLLSKVFFFVHYARDSMLIRVCFMILASEGIPKLKRKKETKAKKGKMAEHDATTKVVSGMHIHFQSHTVIALAICYADQID